MVAMAQTTSFRFQRTWPAKDIFHEFANDFAKKVNDMAGGRLKIEVLPSGAVVPAFQLLEALLQHFQIDPILWGALVFVNLQAAFLSPPVAMSAFYLKGVSPSHVTLNQIFASMMPYMLIVILCMVFMYIWPGMTLWLPKFLYGGG